MYLCILLAAGNFSVGGLIGKGKINFEGDPSFTNWLVSLCQIIFFCSYPRLRKTFFAGNIFL